MAPLLVAAAAAALLVVNCAAAPVLSPAALPDGAVGAAAELRAGGDAHAGDEGVLKTDATAPPSRRLQWLTWNSRRKQDGASDGSASVPAGVGDGRDQVLSEAPRAGIAAPEPATSSLTNRLAHLRQRASTGGVLDETRVAAPNRQYRTGSRFGSEAAASYVSASLANMDEQSIDDLLNQLDIDRRAPSLGRDRAAARGRGFDNNGGGTKLITAAQPTAAAQPTSSRTRRSSWKSGRNGDTDEGAQLSHARGAASQLEAISLFDLVPKAAREKIGILSGPDPSGHPNKSEPVLYYQPLAKTRRDTKALEDIMHLTNTRPCGRGSISMHMCMEVAAFMKGIPVADELTETLAAASRGGCGITSCDMNINTAMQLSLLEVDRRLQLIVGIQDPEHAVIELYKQCLQSNAQPGHGDKAPVPMSLESWLDGTSTATTNIKPSTSLKHCFHNPFNIMTSRLSPYNAGTDSVSFDVGVAKQRVDSAFHVFLAEEYEASVCLLLVRMGQYTSGCVCGAKESVLDLLARSTKYNRTLIEDDGQSTPLTQAEKAKIATLTLLDAELYVHARSRFLRDITAYGLGCLLTKPGYGFISATHAKAP